MRIAARGAAWVWLLMVLLYSFEIEVDSFCTTDTPPTLVSALLQIIPTSLTPLFFPVVPASVSPLSQSLPSASVSTMSSKPKA